MPERTDFYRIRFDAEPVQLMLFRHGLDRWLAALEWPELDRIDVVLAVHEACANVVQHAYAEPGAGDVEVTGRLVVGRADRHLVVDVRDEGVWRPDSGGGLGLTALRGCMATVRIRHDGSGTVVRMASRRTPLTATEAGPVRVEQRRARDA